MSALRVRGSMAHTEKTKNAKAQAKRAGLRYVYDTDRGFTRKSSGKRFAYFGAGGKKITNKAVIKRIDALAIPPAYKDVWICRHANGHIQATGIDARGRKQYRYHADWRAARDSNKFENMRIFAEALPRVRRKVAAALKKRGLPKDKVIAAVVRLLDKTGLRVGSEEYLAENETCGLTTISKKHVDRRGRSVLRLDFPAKGGKRFEGELSDPAVAKVVAQCEDLPGYRLFKWKDDEGKTHHVTSADINGWLQRVSREPITAKDFRTWNACTLFLEEAMEETRCCTDPKYLKLKPILKNVSAQLGNTPAILQKSYVHPELVDLFRTGCFLNREWKHGRKKQPAGYRRTEALLLRWLQKRYAS